MSAEAFDEEVCDQEVADEGMLDESADDDMLALSTNEESSSALEDNEGAFAEITEESTAGRDESLLGADDDLFSGEGLGASADDNDLFGKETPEVQRSKRKTASTKEPLISTMIPPNSPKTENSTAAEIENAEEIEDSLLSLDEAQKRPAPAISKDDAQRRQKALEPFILLSRSLASLLTKSAFAKTSRTHFKKPSLVAPDLRQKPSRSSIGPERCQVSQKKPCQPTTISEPGRSKKWNFLLCGLKD